MRSDELIAESLQKAAFGLLVMSESDYPFEVVQWPRDTDVTPSFLVTFSGSADQTIQQMELEEFLEEEKYRRLVETLRRELSDIKVYKIGRRNIPVYIVGRSPAGSWMGVSTRLIQT